MNERRHALFRASAAVAVATQAPKAETATQAPTINDLTDYVGQLVDGATWAALQTECHRRYAGRWTFYATQTGDNYYIRQLHAKPE